MLWILNPLYHTNSEKFKKAIVLLYAFLITVGIQISYSLVCYYLNLHILFYSISVVCFINFICILLLRTAIKLVIISNLFLISNNVLIIIAIMATNGLNSPLLIWAVIQPLLALFFINYKTSVLWFGLMLIEFATVGFLGYKNITINDHYTHEFDQILYISSIIGFAVILFFTGKMNENRRLETEQKLKEINNELLQKNEELNIQTEEITTQRDMLFEMTQEMENSQIAIMELNFELEQKIQNRTQELSEALKELDNFIYRSAHDIKGPVTTVSGLIYVALMEVTDEKAVMYLNKIKDQTKKTLDLLSRITGISEFKKREPLSQLIDFKLINLRIQKYLAEEEESAYVHLTINIPDNKTIYYSDQRYVELVILNLLDNAIKFRDSFKNTRPYVKLDIRVEENILLISVEDNGIGISEKIREIIFNMFFKGTDKSKGSGLGLYIVKLIIDRLGGELFLDNYSKGKTTFLVKLPELLPQVEIEIDEKPKVKVHN